MTNLEKALLDPARHYHYPKEVLTDDSLTDDEKVQVLKQWEYDALRIQVADEENMMGTSPSMLNRVHRALEHLLASRAEKK